MAAFNFPSSPSNGDSHSQNGVTFTYSSSSGAWQRSSAVGAQGATGSTGAQGATGPTGAQGATGSSGSATLSNNADNRVITGGSGTNLNGEANLTFTGSNLTLTNSSGASELTLVTPSNTDGGVYFNDGSNAGAVTYLHTDNSMKFRVNSTNKMLINSSGNVQVNGGAVHIDANGELAVFETDTNLAFTNSSKLAFDFSGNVARIRTSGNGSFTTRPLAFYTGNDERLRIDSSGKTLIGYDSNGNAPRTRLEVLETHVSGSGNFTPIMRLSTTSYGTEQGPQLQFGTSNVSYPTWTYGDISGVYEGGSFGGAIVFRTNSGSSATAVAERGRWTRDGDLSISDGNLVVASGHGIDFSAGADNSYHNHTLSELLDDYEEGSWLPTWSPASGSVGHQSRTGDYIKIGRVVHCMFAISANGSTNPSGELKVSGLPYSAQLPNAQGLRGGGGVAFAGYHMNTSVTKCMAQGSNVHIILSDNSRLQSNSSGVGYGYNAAQLSGFFSYITA